MPFLKFIYGQLDINPKMDQSPTMDQKSKNGSKSIMEQYPTWYHNSKILKLTNFKMYQNPQTDKIF